MNLPKFPGKVFLAPLAGITDVAFRLRCLHYGAGLVVIPMVNANAIVRKNKATLDLLKTSVHEKPKAVQLFGSKTDVIKQAAKDVVERTDADILDFNMGCPDVDIIKQGAGSALLKRPAKIKEIVETLKSAVNVPVSVKIRIGGSEKSINALKNSSVIEDAGADMIIVHGRTVKQGYSGKADWDVIKKVKENVSIPVVANGDVWDEESAKALFDATKADFIMLGRGAMGRPWIFEKIDHFLKTGRKSDKAYEYEAEFEEYKKLALRFDLTKESKLRQQAANFTKGIEGARKLRDEIMRN